MPCKPFPGDDGIGGRPATLRRVGVPCLGKTEVKIFIRRDRFLPIPSTPLRHAFCYARIFVFKYIHGVGRIKIRIRNRIRNRGIALSMVEHCRFMLRAMLFA